MPAYYFDSSGIAKRYASLTFVSADDDLLKAAEAEGLVTENPNLYV